MIFKMTGYQKVLLFWAKAFGPKIDECFLKEVNYQLDLAFNPIKEVGARITLLEDHIVFLLEISLFNLIAFELYWVRKTDHPGITVEFKLLFLSFRVELRDLRHWDYEKNQLKHPTEL